MSSKMLSAVVITSLLAHGSTLPSSEFTSTQAAKSGVATETPNLPKAAIESDFADPSVIQVDNDWYAFATSGNGKNIQVAYSPTFDSAEWSKLDREDVLPQTGPWTDGSPRIWGPIVTKWNDDDKFVMFYSAPPEVDPSKHCVGAAVSEVGVLGPYVPFDTPLACDLCRGGAIDPSTFRDPQSGKQYIVYKVDGNSLNGQLQPTYGNCSSVGYRYTDDNATPIMLQEIPSNFFDLSPSSPSYSPSPTYQSASLVSSLPPPIVLIDHNATLDGPLVEAPSLFSSGNSYFLLFSSHMYNTDEYDIKYATAPSLAGPWTRSLIPLLHTYDGWGVRAPGGAEVSIVEDSTDDSNYNFGHALDSNSSSNDKWNQKDKDGSRFRYKYNYKTGKFDKIPTPKTRVRTRAPSIDTAKGCGHNLCEAHSECCADPHRFSREGSSSSRDDKPTLKNDRILFHGAVDINADANSIPSFLQGSDNDDGEEIKIVFHGTSSDSSPPGTLTRYMYAGRIKVPLSSMSNRDPDAERIGDGRQGDDGTKDGARSPGLTFSGFA